MMNSVNSSRILALNTSHSNDGKCVLYVMSRDQRVDSNHALLVAQEKAMGLKLPLAVLFCLYPKSGFRAKEHFEFMIEGLREVEGHLEESNIPFIFLIGEPIKKLSNVFIKFNPHTVYFDFNPLIGPRNLQKALAAKHADINFNVVDTHNIIPTWVVSNKQEFAARTIRPKIHHFLQTYLVAAPKLIKHPYEWPSKWLKISDLENEIQKGLSQVTSNGQSLEQISGELAAHQKLSDFIVNRLRGYSANRNDPTINGLSGLSPYLHFGQLSSLQVILRVFDEVRADSSLQPDVDALVEEMVIRKELSDNFCLYNPAYRSLQGASGWAQQTLEKHANDPREFIYSYEELVQSKTHDPAWNAAQHEMVLTGKMHGYMRMYWAKKVLEWTATPHQAIEYLVKLNDFYSIDGGDPNGYVGILWSVAGVHDRPWGERSIFGTIRYMNYAGLKRKFDIVRYEQKWNANNELEI